MIWARRGVSTQECPKSFISGQSIAWLDEFYLWRRFECRNLEQLGARQAEAFLILDRELSAEAMHGEQ